jgi:protein ImuB
LVLVEAVASRQIVACACEGAFARGIRAGMTLAEARALCPGLAHAGHDPEEDARALIRLGRWLTRFSPVVSPAPPDAILLDVTGSQRLFGSDQELLSLVAAALARLKICARMAIAPTPGAAWAVASSEQGDGKVVTIETLVDALAPLPPRALRLDAPTAATLEGLGVETIGQVLALPREALPARFGTLLLLRTDQALGRVDEPLVPLAHRAAIAARMEFDGVVDSPETLWLAFKQLLGRVIAQLIGRGCGARRMEVEFRRRVGPPVAKTIMLSRPSRDAGNLFNLLRCLLETVHDDEGFTAVRLAVPVFERVTEEQASFVAAEQQWAAEAELDHLIARLSIRLGQEAVARARLVESHLPERAYVVAGPTPSPTGTPGGENGGEGGIMYVKREDVKREKRRRRRRRHPERSEGSDSSAREARSFGVPQDDKSTGPSHFTSSRFTSSPTLGIAPASLIPPSPAFPPPRPLHLLARPREVQVMAAPSPQRDGAPVSFTCGGGRVHRIAHCTGPERIAGVWWEGHAKTRDYFDAEDGEGRRFWLFRVLETGRWFVHGVFD